AGIEAWEVLELQGQLVDKSLVVAAEQGEAVRFRLLEPLRQYGHEKLQASDEAVAARERHRDWYLALAEQAKPELWGTEQRAWRNRLDREYANLRAALSGCLEREEAEAGLRMAGALGPFWTTRGYGVEGRALLEKVLALPGAA